MTVARDTFRAPASAPIRDRVVAAAIHVTTTSGWNSVTMGGLADLVGVSRQTVYNEVGAKPDLADVMVQSELARFLAAMNEAAAPHDDLVEAIRAAVRAVLEMARDNPLIHSIASASHGADTDLLPLLTTRSTDLLRAASFAVDELVRPRCPGVPTDRRAGVVDVVVRTVLSHVMAPGRSPATTADTIAWMAGVALGAPTRRRRSSS